MVYSINPDFRQYNYNTINRVKTDSVGKKGTAGTTQTLAFTSNPVNYVPLNPVMNVSPLRTRLEGKEEKNKYNTLLKNLDKDTKKH